MSGKKEKPYERLPGTGYRRLVPAWTMAPLFLVIGIFVLLLRGRRTQLWLGKEHLLLVESGGAREYYKRFDYNDIQAIIVRKTNEQFMVNLFLGIIVLLLVGLGISIKDSTALSIFCGIAAFFGLVLLLNWLASPSCVCHIRTAVQLDELVSLRRVKTAKKVIARIQKRVEEKQGMMIAGATPTAATPTAATPAGAIPAATVDLPEAS